jgi:probable phosphoglycerate mutase
MPTRVYLVRHGATVLTEENRYAGSTDVALSDGGSAANRSKRCTPAPWGARWKRRA